MGRLNGDTKVIIERIGNLKEYMKEEFKNNREEHRDLFKGLSRHGRTISYLKAWAYGVGLIVATIVTILIKTNIG